MLISEKKFYNLEINIIQQFKACSLVDMPLINIDKENFEIYQLKTSPYINKTKFADAEATI